MREELMSQSPKNNKADNYKIKKYNENGQLVYIRRFNHNTTLYEYNECNMLQHVVQERTAKHIGDIEENIIHDIMYYYNDDGNLIKITVDNEPYYHAVYKGLLLMEEYGADCLSPTFIDDIGKNKSIDNNMYTNYEYDEQGRCIKESTYLTTFKNVASKSSQLNLYKDLPTVTKFHKYDYDGELTLDYTGGINIVYGYKDGILVESLQLRKFDIVEFKDIIHYNDNGKAITKISYINGYLNTKDTIVYNDENECVFHRAYNKVDNKNIILIDRRYDEDGNILYEFNNGNLEEYDYNDDGTISEIRTYSSTKSGKKVSKKIKTYKYNKGIITVNVNDVYKTDKTEIHYYIDTSIYSIDGLKYTAENVRIYDIVSEELMYKRQNNIEVFNTLKDGNVILSEYFKYENRGVM